MTTVTSSTTTSATTTTAATSASTAKEASDRFLKLLVTQLQNQDPMNPMDNAQMTSQMAQISTVSGIEKLNTTVQGLTSKFVQMQAMQGAALVGHDVILKGDKLSVDAVVTNGVSANVANGSFDLAGAASNVKVEILSPAGLVVDTLGLGAQTTGRHDFAWPAGSTISESAGYRFRVTATSNAATIPSTALMHDKVNAVNTGGATLTLELARNGNVAYSDIEALN